MILHGYFRSSAAYRVRIAMNLKAIPHQHRTRHLRKGEQREASYLGINPQGLVPTLEVEGASLTQSLAIIEYLEETHPSPALLPQTPADRAYCRSLAQIVACDIHPIDNLLVLSYLNDQLGLDEAAIGRWFNHWISEGFDAIEATLARDPRTGRFCIGDTPTLADIVLVPQVLNAARYRLDMAPYPTISRIDAACGELPAFADAHPRHQPDAE